VLPVEVAWAITRPLTIPTWNTPCVVHSSRAALGEEAYILVGLAYTGTGTCTGTGICGTLPVHLQNAEKWEHFGVFQCTDDRYIFDRRCTDVPEYIPEHRNTKAFTLLKQWNTVSVKRILLRLAPRKRLSFQIRALEM
jgi:hypothetical protein